MTGEGSDGRCCPACQHAWWLLPGEKISKDSSLIWFCGWARQAASVVLWPAALAGSARTGCVAAPAGGEIVERGTKAQRSASWSSLVNGKTEQERSWFHNYKREACMSTYTYLELKLLPFRSRWPPIRSPSFSLLLPDETKRNESLACLDPNAYENLVQDYRSWTGREWTREGSSRRGCCLGFNIRTAAPSAGTRAPEQEAWVGRWLRALTDATAAGWRGGLASLTLIWWSGIPRESMRKNSLIIQN